MPIDPAHWVLALTHLLAGFLGGVWAGHWGIPWVVEWWVRRKRSHGR